MATIEQPTRIGAGNCRQMASLNKLRQRHMWTDGASNFKGCGTTVQSLVCTRAFNLDTQSTQEAQRYLQGNAPKRVDTPPSSGECRYQLVVCTGVPVRGILESVTGKDRDLLICRKAQHIIILRARYWPSGKLGHPGAVNPTTSGRSVNSRRMS